MSRIYGSGIIKSMGIAYRNFFRPAITLQYPHQKAELPERSRWAVRMTCDENGDHKCTACLACERACPDFVIKIEITTDEERKKHIDRWRYEIGACMMCGLCVEACPFDAIHMSHEYELARTDPASLDEDLLVDVPAVGPKRRTAEPAAAPSSVPSNSPASPAAQPAPPAAEEAADD